jgi:hypothetical protein
MNDPFRPLNPSRSWRCFASAAGGTLVWLIACFVVRPDWAACLLLFGPLVIVPLGLALLESDDEGRTIHVTGRMTVLARVLAAFLLVAAFAVSEPGLLAAALTVPWLLFTFWIAWLGAARLARNGLGHAEDLCPNAGMLFLAVGGMWTIASRYGARPMGFDEPIILLTGAHFHFAGFALPVLTGLTGRRLRSVPARVAAVGVMAGVPLVALGITVGSRYPLVEAFAAWEMTAACLLVAALQIRVAVKTRHWIARLLLFVSSLALIAGMGLAAAYALGRFLQRDWLDIPTMIRWHASLNALGFALPGLLAWIVIRTSQEGGLGSVQILWRFLGQRPSLKEWQARSIAQAVALSPQAGDNRDVHERVVAQEAPGPPEPSGAFRALTKAIRAYRIFPEGIVERVLASEPVEVGDTVGASYHAIPGMDLFFASRVTAVLDDRIGDIWRAGFTYQTLIGHPELGEETFSVEKEDATGRITVALRSWSRPGSWLTWVAYPYARCCQLRAGNAALDHLEKLVKSLASRPPENV